MFYYPSSYLGTVSFHQRLGLLSENFDDNDEETEINLLLSMALEKLAFMPFAYLVDRYRWDMYDGTVKAKDLNCHWHKLRLDIQGDNWSNLK